jgi:uncharacterized membrane protein YgcG
METKLLTKISHDLDFLKQEITEIKRHMVDIDTILTPEEDARLEQSLKDYREGKGISLEAMKKKIEGKNV